MKTRIDRWGNSLGVRISKAIAEQAALREGDDVEIDVENGTLRLRAARGNTVEDQLRALEQSGALGPRPPDRKVPPPLDVDGDILQQFLQEDRNR